MRLFISVMLVALSAYVTDVYADKGAQPVMQNSLNVVGDRQLPEDLHNADVSFLKVRLSDLDRKVSGLERENRVLEDRIRNLQRTVDDLRRRSR